MVVAYQDGAPRFGTGKLVSVAPFWLKTTSDGFELQPGQRVLLVQQEGKNVGKASGVVSSVVDGVAEVDNLAYEEVDRRRYPRHEIGVQVSIRAVSEVEQQAHIVHFEGSTKDLSLGGAWINSDIGLAPGSLVDVQITLRSGSQSRILGIIAWTDDQNPGFGIEFLDFVGDARYRLHEFMSQNAA